MTHQHKYVFLCLLAIATLLSAASFQPALAQSLGAASSFAVLGGPVSCTTSVITGDVGVSPTTAAFTNTGCTITGGTPHANDAAAGLAQAAFLGVYNTLNPINPINCGTTISTAAFTGATVGPLVPGVYCFPAAVAFTDTTLTLDGSTNPNGIWIFKVGAALAGSGFQVVLINGAQACNVFWSVGAAVALTTSTLPPLFQGNILAGSTGGAISITGGIVIGRVLANGAVALTNTNIQGSCALVDQAKAICSANDNDEHDRDKDRDKDKDKDKDHEKDKEHERDHEKERDR
jgi:hypothetical protein